jgi:hypothetical protein
MGTNSMSPIGASSRQFVVPALCVPSRLKESARSFPRADHLSPQQLFESNDSSGTDTQPPEEANETRHCYRFPFNTARKNAQLRTKKREDSTLKGPHLAFLGVPKQEAQLCQARRPDQRRRTRARSRHRYCRIVEPHHSDARLFALRTAAGLSVVAGFLRRSQS